jgi:hypothetical protein
MVHGNTANEVIEYISLVIEDMQLMNYFITHETSYGIFIPTGLSDFASAAFHVTDMKNTYTVILVLCAAAVFIMMLNIFVVAWGFVVCVTNTCSEESSGSICDTKIIVTHEKKTLLIVQYTERAAQIYLADSYASFARYVLADCVLVRMRLSFSLFGHFTLHV